MDTKALDQALQEIVAKRGELEKLDYNNPKYDDLEDQLHDLEDDFQDEYGDYLEEAFQNVHDEFCPDNDVLTAIAYLNPGIPVDIDKLPGKDTRLVLYAAPTRIVLALGKDKQQVVWSAEKA